MRVTLNLKQVIHKGVLSVLKYFRNSQNKIETGEIKMDKLMLLGIIITGIGIIINVTAVGFNPIPTFFGRYRIKSWSRFLVSMLLIIVGIAIVVLKAMSNGQLQR